MSKTSDGSRAPFDIAVVGLGVLGIHHITKEAEAVIRRCDRVFVVDATLGVQDYLRSISPNVTSLLHLYETGKPRLPAYQKMAAAVTAAAIESPPTCFATYGHPQIYCYPTALLRRAAPLLGLRVEVFAGVSSLDTLLIDVGYDFSRDGLQMYDATDVLLRRRPLQNDVGCVLWQTTTFADPTYRTEHQTAVVFAKLRDYLLEFYPARHRVFTVYSRTHPALRSIVNRHTIGDLAEALSTGPQSGSIFIPPVQRRPVADDAVAEQLRQAYDAH